MATTIIIHGRDRTLTFAAKELARYLGKATGRTVTVTREAPKRKGKVFEIGLCEAFAIEPPASARGGADWICVKRCRGGYILTGSNPRSVLFAVYRYLEALGFRWIRPGRRGEIVPRLKTAVARGVSISETASYPYRTMCIEGACSEQHIVDMIDWLAKHGMNGYFMQFDYGSCFFERWYRHADNPYMKKEPYDLRQIVGRIIRQLQKRDMRFERMGHGWTCAPLGITGEGWDATRQKLPASKKRWLAEINGKREFWHGVPLNTNLCYSNPKVRAGMVEAIVAYVQTHDDVDTLHLWLADGMNNNCECADCRKARPADFYVDLLNELDEALTTAELDTRIVFLIYVDLLWPPRRARICNQDRFVLMFAPITRSYTESFADSSAGKATTSRYVRNKLTMPENVQVNIQYLQAWLEMFKGEGFDFDYHLMWACYFDPNMISISKVLHKDMQNLGSIGLHGMNSCQHQRMAFPHNLPMETMARVLWDKRTSFKSIMTAWFDDAYGKAGAEVAAFFQEMSVLWRPIFDPVYVPTVDEVRIRKGLRNLAKMYALTAHCRELVGKHQGKGPDAVRWSWKYLGMYLDVLDLLLPAFEAYLKGEKSAKRQYKAVFDYLWRREKTLHPALDIWGFTGVLKRRIAELEEWLRKQ